MRSIESASLSALMIFILAVALAMIGIQTGIEPLIHLSRWVAAVSALLHVWVALSGTRLAVSARRHLIARWGRTRSVRLAPLRRVLRNVTAGLIAAWAVAVLFVLMVPFMRLPVHIPDAGLIYALSIIASSIHAIFGTALYRQLAYRLQETRRLPAAGHIRL
ncbi:hypothetical protein [Lysobacter antibioticus]|uniref:Transmembrane protein n=1 Tax=Lysobacter antibioticus TaxID=84531 RepID=A0A0S2FI27_LYSAN|nr:hypothetical protein [Lysobacter antibioticus]ALN83222.1 hypothetical protein LA76x_5120 [Lysobacter antibioticus]